MTTRGLPEGRYGPSRPRSRWAAPALVVAAVLAGLVVAVVGYRNLADPPIQGERLGFTLLGDAAVEIRFEVARKDPARDGMCVLRARSLDGDETGRREVYVPPATGRVELTTIVRTSRPPVSGDVFGCTLQVPPYLRPTASSAPAAGAGG